MLQEAESIQALISKMEASGGNVNIDLAQSIIERKDEALPYLAEMVRNESHWKSKDIDAWVPINAMHLLSGIGGKEALEAIMYAIHNFTEEMGDWLTEDLPSVLAYLGPSAFEALATALSDSKLDPFARNSIGRALLSISRTDEDLKRKTIESFVNAISNEKDILSRTLLVDVLIDFKEKETLPFVRALFSKNLVDRSFLQPEEVEDVFAGRYDDTVRRDDNDPMDLFRQDKSEWYSAEVGSARNDVKPETYLEEPLQNSHKPKIGRNEPCPCGSGKKYKKCCLIKDRQSH